MNKFQIFLQHVSRQLTKKKRTKLVKVVFKLFSLLQITDLNWVAGFVLLTKSGSLCLVVELLSHLGF